MNHSLTHHDFLEMCQNKQHFLRFSAAYVLKVKAKISKSDNAFHRKNSLQRFQIFGVYVGN